jgi:hypothetical protein
MKTVRKPYLVQLKPEFAAAYKGKLEVGREYQALFSLNHPDFMEIVGTEVSHADKRHFMIKAPA